MARPRNKYQATSYLIDADDLGIMNQRVVVRTANSLPPAVDGVITLADSTTYLINGTIDISPNRIVCGVKNTIGGEDKQNDILTSNTTGALLTLDSTGTDKAALTLNTIGLRCPNGTIFNVTSSTLRNVFIIDNCNLTTCVNTGTVHNCTSFVVRTSAFLTATNSGVTFTGVNGNFSVKDSQFRTVAGSTFALGTSTFTTFDISRNLCAPTTGETFLSGAPTISTYATLHDNIFSGAGTYVTGISGVTTNWLWTANVGVTNSPLIGTPSDGDKGDITVSASGATWTIDNDAVTFAKMQDIATAKLLGRATGGSGNIEEITLGTNLSYTGTTLNAAGGGISDGDKGDITVSAAGATWTIDNTVVTYAKMQDVSATDRLLGRSTAGAGVVEEITCTAAGRAILDDADNTAQRSTLGLGTLATQSGTFSGTSSGTNTGDQTSIVGITGTMAQFDTAVSDGNIVYQSQALGTPASGTLTNCTGLPNTGVTGLGTLSTQSGTFSGTSSGTNTGDQSIFSTVAVSGQSNVVADTTSDTLTLVAGTNITITTDAGADSVTINATGGGSGLTQPQVMARCLGC